MMLLAVLLLLAGCAARQECLTFHDGGAAGDKAVARFCREAPAK